MNPFDQPRKFLEYPQSFDLRIIHDSDKAADIQSTVTARLSGMGFSRGALQVLPSSKPRFGRLSVPVCVENEEQMNQLFDALCGIPGVRYVV